MYTERILPTLYNLNQYIPPSLLSRAVSFYSSFDVYAETVRSDYLNPYIIYPLTTLMNSPPDLSSILILFLVLVLSLKILDYARRIVMFWVTLALRLVLWGALLGGAYYVYTVGWQRASREAGWLIGLFEGFLEEFLAGKENGRSGRETPPLYAGLRQDQQRMW